MITSFFIIWLTNFVIGVIEFLIGLRIILKLLGVGLAPFVQWVYQTSQPLLNPFEGMFPTTRIAGTAPTSVLEFSAVFGFLVYAFIGFLLVEIIRFFAYRRDTYYADDVEEERVVRRKR